MPPGDRDLNASSGGGSSLPGRLARYARIAAVLGRFMARLASERYLGGGEDGAALARELKDALGRLRGPLVKVAQLLATVPGALPADYVAELMTLQSQAPAMGSAFVRRRMAGELGPGWQSRFREFDPEAAAAASLGQVHRAIGQDGRALACKLQYPDMDTAVDADLRGLDIALRVLQQYQRALLMGSVRAELEARLREELDYALEARHMALYRDILQGEPRIAVPEPEPELSTRRLLTMTWLEGEPILSRLERAAGGRDMPRVGCRRRR
jgi:predicted unusual protein kinase regulating ubiquinone biosynthesis (AarF/ABC1/UbiB family)